MITAMDRLEGKPFWASCWSGILLWGAFPPLGLFWLAPLALLPWLLLIARKEPLERRDYMYIWLASCGLWLALLQGVRLAYWPLYAGWFALSIYVAIYIPIFIAVSRLGYHRLGIPIWIIAPVVWIGTELFRGYFATGFSTCLLAHTQVRFPISLQIAAHLGSYGVSATVVLIGCGLFSLLQRLLQPSLKPSWMSVVVPLGLVASSWLYGGYALSESQVLEQKEPLLRVALIQDNSPTMFEANRERNQRSWNAYLNETENAAKRDGVADIVVWPESVFTANEPIMKVESQGVVPPDLIEQEVTPTSLLETEKELQRILELKVKRVLAAAHGDSLGMYPGELQNPKTHLLLGTDLLRVRAKATERYNSALWVGPDGHEIDLYSKQHLVMFGEYFPGGSWFPFLYQTFGMAPVYSGERPVLLEYDGVTISPSICFENTLPHFLRRQLRSHSVQPDLMINISNDGWFRGSSIQDLHLASGILAAVENRRPMLIAANTGLSAWIDGSGRQVAVTKRMSADSILAMPRRDGRWGLWQTLGDWPARLCLVASILVVIVANVQGRRV